VRIVFAAQKARWFQMSRYPVTPEIIVRTSPRKKIIQPNSPGRLYSPAKYMR